MKFVAHRINTNLSSSDAKASTAQSAQPRREYSLSCFYPLLKKIYVAGALFVFVASIAQPLAQAAPAASTTVATEPATNMPELNRLPFPATSTQASPNKGTGKNTNSAATVAATAANAPTFVVTGDYILGPDDQISIVSQSHNEVSAGQVTIPYDGKVNLPMLGPVYVIGKTIARLEKDIAAIMDKAGYLRPVVTVSLTGARPNRVFVLGTVGSAGAIDIKPGWRISDVLATAGGLAVRPELAEGTLTRPGNPTPIKLDLPAIMRDSNTRANLPVQNGDTLRFIPRTVQINVAGQVSKSGTVDVPLGSSVVEALALAGGVGQKAALTRVTIKRNADGAIVPVDLHRVLVLGQPELDIPLYEGDLIMVPEAKERVTVQGAVRSPGYYDIEDGKPLRLSEVLALAGGTTDDASLTRTTLKRADGTMRTLDLFRVLALGSEEDNIQLEPNDIITVPAYKERVVVTGSGVRSGGFFGVEEGTTMRILDALTSAGGLSGDPEGVRIVITRGMPGSVPTLDPSAQKEPTFINVNAIQLINDNDPNANIPLQNGDLITVTALPSQVYLVGEVPKPGMYEFKRGEGLTELLARAGGVSNSALLSAIIVERDGKKYTVDVFKALISGDQVDFPLMNGDNIVVPKNMNRVLLIPAVSQPGYQSIPEDRPLMLTEALAMAGGPSNARLKDVVLLRQNNKGSLDRVPMPLHTSEQWVKASKTQMQSGDIVFVPVQEGKKPNIGTRIGQVLGFTGLFGLPLPW